MDEEKFIMVSLDDENSKDLAEVLGNKTCKKIVNYLVDVKEASEKDLSDALEIPINTVEYNLKKLLKSRLIQKRKNFFWSKKGKKIVMYELSNKSIIISPRKKISEKFKSIIPGFILTAVGTFAVYVYEKIQGAAPSYSFVQSVVSERAIEGGDVLLEETSSFVGQGGEIVTKSVQIASSDPNLWLWFLFGALIILMVFSIVNWRKL